MVSFMTTSTSSASRLLFIFPWSVLVKQVIEEIYNDRDTKNMLEKQTSLELMLGLFHFSKIKSRNHSKIMGRRRNLRKESYLHVDMTSSCSNFSIFSALFQLYLDECFMRNAFHLNEVCCLILPKLRCKPTNLNEKRLQDTE